MKNQPFSPTNPAQVLELRKTGISAVVMRGEKFHSAWVTAPINYTGDLCVGDSLFSLNADGSSTLVYRKEQPRQRTGFMRPDSDATRPSDY